MRTVLWGLSWSLLLACSPASRLEDPMSPVAAPDGGASDGGAPLDAGVPDAGVAFDAGLPDAGVPFDAGLPDGGTLPPPHAPLPPNQALQHDRFATGVVCGDCHSASPTSTALRDARGQPLGLVEPWSASTMANSVRDPLFRAAWRRKCPRVPAAADAIAAVCLTCHARMGRARAARPGSPVRFSLATSHREKARSRVTASACARVTR